MRCLPAHRGRPHSLHSSVTTLSKTNPKSPTLSSFYHHARRLRHRTVWAAKLIINLIIIPDVHARPRITTPQCNFVSQQSWIVN